MKSLPLLLLLAVLLSACGPRRTVVRSFFHWQSTEGFFNKESEYLDTLQIERVYARMFEVDWDSRRQRAFPLRTIKDLTRHEGREIVPHIAISDRCMQQIPARKIPELANQIHERLMRLMGDLRFSEVLIDCPWTEASQENYAAFLDTFMTAFGDQAPSLSVSLHPYHVQQSAILGVPAADRAMLLLFEYPAPAEEGDKVSILPEERLRNQLQGLPMYPLPVDLALPVFNWGVVVRNQATGHMFRHLHNEDLRDREKIEVLGPKFLRVKKDCYLDGVFLFQNDLIRLEEVPLDEMMNSVRLIEPLIKGDSLHVGLYHLDVSSLQRYSIGDLEDVFDRFD